MFEAKTSFTSKEMDRYKDPQFQTNPTFKHKFNLGNGLFSKAPSLYNVIYEFGTECIFRIELTCTSMTGREIYYAGGVSTKAKESRVEKTNFRFAVQAVESRKEPVR